MGGTAGGDLGAPARPQVCGVLGRPDPETVRRLLDRARDTLVRVVDEPFLIVAATSRGLHPWRYGAGEGWTWGATARDRTPTGWQDAARRTGAAGFWRDGPTGGIHTDQLALHDVYVREIGDATYFSTELEQLFPLDDAALTPDPAAWAACLAFGAPFGATTPVTQVRRLTPGAAVTVAADGRRAAAATEPFWAGRADAAPTPAELVELLVAAVPGGPDPAVVTLSGGWDSRVLARLALRRGQPLEAWTTYQYHPQEQDVQLAGPVALALGIPHRLVLPRGRNWARQLSVVRRRTAHQTWLHAWLHPLARDLRSHSLPVYDGLLGDALLRANLAQRTARSPDLADGLLSSLTGKRLRRLDERTSGHFTDALAELLREVTDPVADHPNAPTVAQLLVRQTRAIGASAGRVFGPELDVLTPFAHPDVVAGALAVPLADKEEKTYYLELLSLVCGPEGALPSTNDPRLRSHKKADSFLGVPLIEALAAPVRDSPTVLALLEPAIRDVVRVPERLPELRRQPGTVAVLAWAALLADWQQRHGSRLDWSGWPG